MDSVDNGSVNQIHRPNYIKKELLLINNIKDTHQNASSYQGVDAENAGYMENP